MDKTKLLKQIFYFVLYFIGIFVFTLIFHEIGHAIAALILGIPFAEIEYGFIGINPCVTIPERFASSPLTPLYYAGGFTAAGVLLVIYVFWYLKNRKNPTLFSWFAGLSTITAFGIQLGQGYIEGSFHALYMLQAGYLWGLKDIFVNLGVAVMMVIHFNVFQTSRIIQIIRNEIS